MLYLLFPGGSERRGQEAKRPKRSRREPDIMVAPKDDTRKGKTKKFKKSKSKKEVIIVVIASSDTRESRLKDKTKDTRVLLLRCYLRWLLNRDLSSNLNFATSCWFCDDTSSCLSPCMLLACCVVGVVPYQLAVVELYRAARHAFLHCPIAILSHVSRSLYFLLDQFTLALSSWSPLSLLPCWLRPPPLLLNKAAPRRLRWMSSATATLVVNPSNPCSLERLDPRTLTPLVSLR